MTSLIVGRDGVIGRHAAILRRTVVVLATLLQCFQSTIGCILLLDGWSPMSAGERATLADIVAVGVVGRTFKHDRSDDGAATYSAEVRLFDVFKGRQLVDSVTYRLEEDDLTSGYGGNNFTSGGLKIDNSSGWRVIRIFSYGSTLRRHHF